MDIIDVQRCIQKGRPRFVQRLLGVQGLRAAGLKILVGWFRSIAFGSRKAEDVSSYPGTGLSIQHLWG